MIYDIKSIININNGLTVNNDKCVIRYNIKVMDYVNNNFNIEFYIMNNHLSTKDKISIGLSGIMGVGVGLLSSLLTNITLTEISISPFFTIYFGLIFIILGTLIIWSLRNN